MGLFDEGKIYFHVEREGHGAARRRRFLEGNGAQWSDLRHHPDPQRDRRLRGGLAAPR